MSSFSIRWPKPQRRTFEVLTGSAVPHDASVEAGRMVTWVTDPHRRVGYRDVKEPIATKVIEVDAPGISCPRLDTFDYQSLRRPVFPLDREASWRDS